MHAIDSADGEQGDFEIEVHHPLDDHPSGASAAALLRIAPGFAELISRADKALAFAGGAHHRFNDAWQTDLGNRRAEAFFAVGKPIAGGGKLQLFRRQAANAFAVHGELCRPRRGDHFLPGLFQFDQGVGSDSFDLRHDVIRFFLFNQGAQALAVQHIDDVGAVGDLHRRGIGVAVYGDGFNAQTLTFNSDFFTQLAGT